MKGSAEVKEKLGKFFIEVGKEKREELVISDLVEKIKCQIIRDSFVKEPLKVVSKSLNKSVQNLFKTSRQNIQAKILSRQKIP